MRLIDIILQSLVVKKKDLDEEIIQDENKINDREDEALERGHIEIVLGENLR